MSNLSSTPSGPSPIANHQRRHQPSNPNITNQGERIFGTTLWEKKLEKKVIKKKLLKQIQEELLQETLADLRKVAESLEDDKWKYEKLSFDRIKLPF
jgi:hypothetical protein